MMDETLLNVMDAAPSSVAAGPAQAQYGPPFVKKDFFKLLILFPGLTTAFVFVGLFECPAIPSLPAFVLTFALVNGSSTLLKIWFKIEDFGPPRKDPAFHVANALSLALLGVAAWGAAITFGGVSTSGSTPELECAAALYWSGFVPPAIVTTIVVGMAVVGVVKIVRRRFFGSGSSSSALKFADTLPQV